MRTIIFLLTFCFITIKLTGQDVDEKLAQKVAENYFDQNVHDSIKNKYRKAILKANGLKLNVKKAELKTFNGNPSYYINNIEGGGWVLVSSDKKTGPVIAYSEHGHYDMNNLPEAIKIWMAQYDTIIERRRLQKGTLSAEKDEKWKKYDKDGSMLKSSGIFPYYLIQSTWSQDCPYNAQNTEQLPHNDGEHSEGSLCPTGCGPIAIGQILKYWGFSEGDKSDFEFWNMSNSLTCVYLPLQYPEIKATSYMIRVIGKDKLNQTYCDGGKYQTGGDLDEPGAFEKLGYSRGDFQEMHWYTLYNDWIYMLHTSIDEKCPVLYLVSGHDLICDGYNNANGNLHFNLGDPDLNLWVDYEDMKCQNPKLNCDYDYTDLRYHKFYRFIFPNIKATKTITGITLSSGENKTWQAYFSLVANSLTINSGAKSQLVAGDAIFLEPNFWAKQGSSLTVKPYISDNLFYAPLKSANSNDSTLMPVDIKTSSSYTSDVSIFPNPAYTDFAIETPSSGKGTYQLFDFIGKLALSGSFYSRHTLITLQNIPTGPYILKINFNNKPYQFKLIHN